VCNFSYFFPAHPSPVFTLSSSIGGAYDEWKKNDFEKKKKGITNHSALPTVQVGWTYNTQVLLPKKKKTNYLMEKM